VVKKLKVALIAVVVIGALIFLFRIAFIRTVDYEIAGIKIPSKYNILTGKVKPIDNYKGKKKLKTIETTKSNKLGLTEEQVVIARFRWAVFQEWANSKPEYKGWQDNPVIFKKANEDFKQLIKNRQQ